MPIPNVSIDNGSLLSQAPNRWCMPIHQGALSKMIVYRVYVDDSAMVAEPSNIRDFWRPYIDHASPTELDVTDVEWIAPKSILRKPQGIRFGIVGDFFRWSSGQFCVPKATLDKLGGAITDRCRLYPIRITDQRVYVANVSLVHQNIVNTLASSGKKRPSGEYLSIQDWVFKENCLSVPGLFRVHEDRRAMLVATDGSASVCDFYRRYHDLGLQGLRFKELWSSNS